MIQDIAGIKQNRAYPVVLRAGNPRDRLLPVGTQIIQHFAHRTDDRVRLGAPVIFSVLKIMPDLNGHFETGVFRAHHVPGNAVTDVHAGAGRQLRQARGVQKDGRIRFAAAILAG